MQILFKGVTGYIRKRLPVQIEKGHTVVCCCVRVGLRRSLTHPFTLNPVNVIDFWRILYSNKEEIRLLLFAEIKLPGEAWL